MSVRRANPRNPSLRRHKPSGLGVVTLNGKDHYLGLLGVCRVMIRLPASRGLRDSHTTWTSFWGAGQYP